jgi:type IV pilus assembly protein PilA
MKRIQNGFTLIELMIVVAIIGILASIALPAYQTYIARSQVTEAMNLVSGLKIEFTSAYGESGSCPVNGLDGFGNATDYQGKFVDRVDFGGPIGSVSNSTCSITLTFKTTNIYEGLAGKKIIVAMTLPTTGGVSQWEIRQSVTNGDVPRNMLPTSVR